MALLILIGARCFSVLYIRSISLICIRQLRHSVHVLGSPVSGLCSLCRPIVHCMSVPDNQLGADRRGADWHKRVDCGRHFVGRKAMRSTRFQAHTMSFRSTGSLNRLAIHRPKLATHSGRVYGIETTPCDGSVLFLQVWESVGESEANRYMVLR